MREPCRNGSSGTTIEVLLLLTVVGASALTLLGLRRERPPATKDEDATDAEDRDPDAS